ncbi:DBH-like monooxygenase protein 1 precursor isoform A [Alligator mississippiensis]|uniref:DBH-like monooxygenase protein 1 isoform A n=1 Tax=Alligator mississippiensis TaxID=8496 RepID=A0A151NL48_ALLMI|nr:DBH-like monooxygenase protein 1 precursor isoform A [Alligator mississippiensis]
MIIFEVQVRTTGWVAFGITPHGQLPGSDLVIGGVFPNGSIYFSDWHVVDERTIKEDESQDYQLLSLTEDETFTTMRFKRYCFTCDPNDRDITRDTERLVSAFGTDDTVEFFKGQRSIKSLFLMRFMNPENLHEPQIFYTYDLKLTDFHVPVEETTYACTFLPLPMVKKKHHIYKFAPVITPHNVTLIHHILVYACGNASVLPSGVSDCYGADPDFALCSQVLVGWAVGGGDYTFPDDTGISIGTPLDPQYIRLEIHYSNFDLLTGLIDSSGIRLFFTPNLRKYDMGVLQTGVFTFPVHFIPPGSPAYHSYGLCNSSQFEEMNGTPVPDMHVFGYLLHTHLTGRGVRVVQYRNGKQLGFICADNKYDFNLQETRDLKEILIVKAGDEILVECTFETLDRTGITFGGPSTLNEMCLAFLFYYPRSNISSCMGYPDIQYIAQALGQQASDAMEGMMAMNFVEWDNETIKNSEKAAKEADQIVIIKTIDEVQKNETGIIREIIAQGPDPCRDISGHHPVPVAGLGSRLVKDNDTQAGLMSQEVNITTKEPSQPKPGGRCCSKVCALALVVVTVFLLATGVTLIVVFSQAQKSSGQQTHSAATIARERGLPSTPVPSEPRSISKTSKGLPTSQGPSKLQTVSKTSKGCPSGWRENGTSCYFFSEGKDKKSWNASMEECKKNGSKLVIINSKDELDFLNRTSRNYYYFLGLMYSNTTRKWNWIDDTELDTDIFNVKRDFFDYCCAVVGHNHVASADCNGSSTTDYMCEKAVE